MMETVLVVAAHADDEALGCGGTIASWAAVGAEVHVLFLTNGMGARNVATSDPGIARRSEAAAIAGAILGTRSTTQFDLPDNRLDGVDLLDVVQAIERVISDIRPEVVFTHCADDLNVDHRVCNQAVVTACRPQPGYPVRSIFGFEVASSTEWAFGAPAFAPNYFVDITNHLETKLKALDAYHEEMRDSPHPRSTRSITALARWRGATVGCEAAEAFTVIRQIVRKT